MVTKVTERDRHLCGVLGEVRWVDVARMHRLLPGRALGEVRSTLERLTTGRALFRREQWLSRRGYESVYCLTDAGYQEAVQLLERELEAPPRELNAQLMEHHFGVVDLYLGLLTHGHDAELQRRGVRPELPPQLRRRLLQDLYAKPVHPQWRWTMDASEARLPWRQALQPGRPVQDRYLQPDAVIELPQHRVRSFIEFESGAHTLQPVSPDKPNATSAKLARYGQFLTGRVPPPAPIGTTWYAQRYRDDYRPELVLVEPTLARVQNVKAVLAAWLRSNHSGREPFKVRVLTPAETVERYRLYVGAPPASRPRAAALTEREASALVDYVNGVRRLVEQRALAREPLPRELSVSALMKRIQAG